MSELTAEQKQLWHLLGIPPPCLASKRCATIIVFKSRDANREIAG